MSSTARWALPKSAWFLTHRIREAMRAGDTAAARRYAEHAVKACAVGISVHGFAVASRSTTALNTAGLTLIDPWTVMS